jgi:hypothetical protein
MAESLAVRFILNRDSLSLRIDADTHRFREALCPSNSARCGGMTLPT